MFRLREFRRSSDERLAYDIWAYERPIVCDLGPYQLELQTERSQLPDERMLNMAGELVEYAARQATAVADLVVASYKRRAATDPAWFRSLGIAANLSPEAVLTELENERWLRVVRDAELEPVYSAVLHLIPRWDHEHAFRLAVRDGKAVELNDSASRLMRLVTG